jgi:hypothetical protein
VRNTTPTQRSATSTTTAPQPASRDEALAAPGAERRDAFAGRLFGAAIEALDLATIRIGERLGLFAALADRGALTAAELAAADVDERYAREWLEQQAITGILEVDDMRAAASARRYALPPEHAKALLDETSLAHVGPLARAVDAVYGVLPAVAREFRAGGGVPYADYGPPRCHPRRDPPRTVQRPHGRPQLQGPAALTPLLRLPRTRPTDRTHLLCFCCRLKVAPPLR